MKIDYFLSSEEFNPRELVRQARMAEEAALDVLRRSSPRAQPMMSRAGIRTEARRARSIMRAHMRDQLDRR